MSVQMTEKVKVVYEAISEFLGQNKPFKYNKIIPYLTWRLAKTSLNINKEGLKEVVKVLLKKKLVVEGSTLKREDLLQFPTRSEIYSIITNNPGITFIEIAEKSKLNNNVIYWHLNLLLKFDCIQKAIIDNRQVFFCSKVNPEEAKRLHFISKEISKQIIQYLEENDIGVTKTQIATDLNMHNAVLTKYLETLEDFNVVVKDSRHRNSLYFLKEKYF